MARETFGIQQVVARIYDPGRAEVYQRLGITTVATVKWTADQVLRRHPAGRRRARLPRPVRHDPRRRRSPVNEAWVGQRTVEFQEQSALPGSPGSTGSARACCPTRDTVIQEGDLLHLVMREENAGPRLRRVRRGPEDELMRVAIAGAGAVGRSIARELIDNGHKVLLIDKDPDAIKPERVPDAEWLLADSCELSSLEEARLDRCDVVIAATGDDKVNLVTSLLAKTEFAVPRTVGRVNHPNNEWLFTEAWGVDVNVSTPRIMSALVEEAVTVGDLVRLFTFRQGNANLVEMTLPEDSPYVGKPAGLIPWPENCSLVTILRDGQVYTPDAEQPDRGRRRAAVRGLRRRRAGAREPAGAGPALRYERRRHAALGHARRSSKARDGANRPDGRVETELRPGPVRRRRDRRDVLDRRVVARQQPDHGAEGGELERPAHRDLGHAERATAVSASIEPDFAAEVDRHLHGDAQHAREHQHQVSVRAEPHDLAVAVPGGRVAGDRCRP